MSDTSTSASLATRAKRLTALARAKKENEKESQDLGQVQTAVNKLNQELAMLKGVLEVHRKLNSVGVPVAKVQGLTEAPQRLQNQIDTVGRPTSQFLNARSRALAGARSAIDDANLQAWRGWADQQIEALPLQLLPRVPFHSRNETTTRIAGLRKLAAGKPVIADIMQFQLFYDRVQEELDSVEVATIDEVLKRFAGGRIRLADLSDAELEMLREEEPLSDQLYLHIAP